MDKQNTAVALRSWQHRGDMPAAAIKTCLSAADLIESLQSQLAAANERADGLQKIVDAARAQKPDAWMYQSDNPKDGGKLTDIGVSRHQWMTEQKNAYGLPIEEAPLYAAAPVPAQPAVVPEWLDRSSD